MNRIAVFIWIILFICIGCEIYPQDEYEEHYVVEAYLVANDTLPEVWVSKTSPMNEKVTHGENFISEANVEIRLLNADSSVADVYQYQGEGVYHPQEPAVVKPQRLYQLHVQLSNNQIVKSYTFVPGTFETVNKLEESYIYQSDQQINVEITPNPYPDQQGFYIFTANAKDTSKSNLTPFYRDLVKDKDSNVKTYYINSSNIIYGNERSEDGNIFLIAPWTTIAFYGQNEILVNAMDDNLYNFWRSYNQQAGLSPLVPGELQNIRYNVDGGIGIFGSMATDTHQVRILKPDQQD